MYRLIGDNHTLAGLSFSTQVFLRALDSVRSNLAAQAGVTNTELRALGRVAEETELPQSTLTQHLELPEHDGIAIVDSLVEQGLLTRSEQSSGAEGTVPVLVLTSAGHSVMERVYLDFQATIDAAADSLDDERRYAFDSAMLKMARKLDAAAAAGKPKASPDPEGA